MSDNKDTKFVFRLQNENKGLHGLFNTIKHWGGNYDKGYDDKQINTIDSSNEHSEHEPTSIPSPFARIALAKTAFAEVAERGERALAAYQKIVSDSLDVAEIFFTFDKWKEEIEIIKWDKKTDLQKLSQHKILHKTLKTFLDNDAEIYNFDKMQCIYILKHKKTGKMIGATSPCTLFFSLANKVTAKIPLSNNHSAFNGIFPLYKRSWDFQKYLYIWLEINKKDDNLLRKGENTPVFIFGEFDKYLDAQKKLQPDKIEEIENHLPKDFNDYDELRAPDVEVLGKPLHHYKKGNIKTEEKYLDNNLLENKIIRLPYKIQKGSFFDGNLNETSQYSYLLPVSDAFFKYYSVDELQKWIRINENGTGGSVTVQLNIPNLQQEIKREYKENETIIKVERDFDCAIFPNIKFKTDDKAHFRIGLVCDFTEKDNFNIEFAKCNGNVELKKIRLSVRNETKESNRQLKNYLLSGSNFDYIKLSYKKENTGIILPKMKSESGSDEFTFAVDFGTTNTHIEYKTNKKNEQTFDITKQIDNDESQVHWLYGGEDELKYVFDEEYIPAHTDEEFHFPMRSALSYGENTNWKDVYPFEKAGIAVLYEKRLGYPYNSVLTDLKWSDNDNNQKQIQCYIESIMYLIRNKVLLNNGILEKTKIRWFYPVSMEKGRYNNLKNAWENSYKKYFGNDTKNITSLTESIAPFEYYVKDGNSDNLVTIDIGGGTTDIVVAKERDVQAITSFRFAANTIFGDGYSENRRVKNGIIRQFTDIIRAELKTKFDENDTVFKIFKDMEDNKSSADIASFLFSLKYNKDIREKGENLANTANLNFKLVNDTTQKITFIFFYSAIIYHLAKIMQAKKLDMPDKIVFSGNGSRVIPFFTDDIDILKGFTKLIFKKVYNKKEYQDNDLEILLNKENPKEATCKGSFCVDKSESFSETIRKKVVLHSNGNKEPVIQLVKEDIENVKQEDSYKAITADYLNKTVEEAKTFINFVFELLPYFANEGYKLNPTSIETAKAVCSQKLDIYAKNGWELKKKEITNSEVIEETLFFYPLTGMLKALGDAICDKNKSNINN